MGKSTISMAMFNSYVTNYQRVVDFHGPNPQTSWDRCVWLLQQRRVTRSVAGLKVPSVSVVWGNTFTANAEEIPSFSGTYIYISYMSQKLSVSYLMHYGWNTRLLIVYSLSVWLLMSRNGSEERDCAQIQLGTYHLITLRYSRAKEIGEKKTF